MKPPPLEYADPATLEEAISILSEHNGEAKILAGGQSLIPLLSMRLARPATLVDMRRIPDLDYVREENGGLAIGAMTTERTIERSELVKNRLPLLHEATRCIGHPQIRNRGTIGGSLVHADPAAEYPAMALAMGAEMRVAGSGGERTIAAQDFFVTYLTTALEPAEVVTEVRLPALPVSAGWSFQEVTRRRGDFALAGAAVVAELGGGGEFSSARIVLFGVGATPVRASAAEDLLMGEKPDGKLLERVGQAASDGIDEPMSDIHGTSEYRRHLAGVLTRRALAEAVSRAGGAAA